MIQADQKVIVIGSNSFSGSHFVKHLLDLGMHVLGISRSSQPPDVFLPYKWDDQFASEFQFFQGDMNTQLDQIKEQIDIFQPSYIVNFAAQGMVAQSWENPEQWFETNMMSGLKLHRFLTDKSYLKKFVQISTPEVYGSCEGFVKENALYNPSTPYAVSKAAADMSLMTFFKRYKFPVIFIRSANVYGPGQSLYRIIPRAALFFLLGKSIELHGGGTSIRSFVYIKDVCEGISKAMLNAEPGNIYHFATPDAVSIRELVERIAHKTNQNFSAMVKMSEGRPGNDNAYLLDCEKAQRDLGWGSRISLDEGLNQTLEWIRDTMEILKTQNFDYQHKP